jgi:hypothetical protein
MDQQGLSTLSMAVTAPMTIDAYQINQAKIAIAKGGFMGVGPAIAPKEISCHMRTMIYLSDHHRGITA